VVGAVLGDGGLHLDVAAHDLVVLFLQCAFGFLLKLKGNKAKATRALRLPVTLQEHVLNLQACRSARGRVRPQGTAKAARVSSFTCPNWEK
jgi:hypothetical protein